MRKLFNQINKLTNEIELGIYTKAEAMYKIRSLRSDINDKFDEGTDNHTELIYCLIDANNLIN